MNLRNSGKIVPFPAVDDGCLYGSEYVERSYVGIGIEGSSPLQHLNRVSPSVKTASMAERRRISRLIALATDAGPNEMWWIPRGEARELRVIYEP
jgi:hypothetical protein